LNKKIKKEPQICTDLVLATKVMCFRLSKKLQGLSDNWTLGEMGKYPKRGRKTEEKWSKFCTF
jgi:hypothetical protein